MVAAENGDRYATGGSYRFATKADAQLKAIQVAKVNRGAEVYILEAVQVAKTAEPPVTLIDLAA